MLSAPVSFRDAQLRTNYAYSLRFHGCKEFQVLMTLTIVEVFLLGLIYKDVLKSQTPKPRINRAVRILVRSWLDFRQTLTSLNLFFFLDLSHA